MPHTQLVEKDFSQCAYSMKVRRFPTMMKPYGYKIVTYASEENESECDELVMCITRAQQEYFLREYDWYKKGVHYKIPFDIQMPIWKYFISQVKKELKKRVKSNDLILITNSIFARDLGEFSNKIIEWSVGYYTVHAPYRVFESKAGRSFCYGYSNVPEYTFQNDAVIPNFYNVNDFPYQGKKDDYLLFMARPVPLKGLSWIYALASEGHKIKIAGAQKIEGKNIEWIGRIEGKKKATIMGRAKALLSPTLYHEPFGGVVAEAALCGTPSIATPWGAFPETIEDGKTGFLCNSYTEAKEAIKKLKTLDTQYIRERAVDLYSTEAVGIQYDTYFKRVIQS